MKSKRHEHKTLRNDTLRNDTLRNDTLQELRDEAFRESIRPKALLEHTWAAGVVLFIVCLVAMTIDNI